MSTEDLHKATDPFDPTSTEVAGRAQRGDEPPAAAGLRHSADPKLDTETLTAIMRADSGAPNSALGDDRLAALKAWREALLRRRESERGPTATTAPPLFPPSMTFGDPTSSPPALDLASSPAALDLRGLERASSHAGVDTFRPEFEHRGVFSRGFARILARAVAWASRFLTVRQGVVNSVVIEYVAEVGDRLNRQQVAMSQLADGVQELMARQNGATASRLRELQIASEAIGRHLAEIRSALHAVIEQSAGYEAKLVSVECDSAWSKVAEFDAREEFGRISLLLNALDSQLGGQGERLASLGGRMKEYKRELERQGQRIGDADRAQALVNEVADRAQASVDEVAGRANALEESLSALAQRTEDLVAAEPAEPLSAAELTGHVHSALDGLYVNLENEFRGSRELIKERLQGYLPLVREIRAGSVEAPVLDLGSGRGEWLELLGSEGLVGRGVETNSVAVSNSRSLGLDVSTSDALEYLQDQKGRSVGMLTAFHLLEHLPFEYMVELLGESLRVLKPGGVAVFETPNPENVVVSSNTFYCDPTHRQPLVPQLLVFLMKQQGFNDLRVERLVAGRPDDRLETLDAGDPLAERLNPVIGLLNRHFAAPSDFAVVGRRPL